MSGRASRVRSGSIRGSVLRLADHVELRAGGRRVEILRAAPAHSAGDLVVVVADAGVAHVGDLFSGGYPFLRVEAGRSVGNLLGAYDERWGGGFTRPEQWVRMVYRGIVSAGAER